MYSLSVLMFFFIALSLTLLFFYINRDFLDPLIIIVGGIFVVTCLFYISCEIYERAKILDNIPVKQELEPGGPR